MCVPDVTVHTRIQTRIHLTVYFWTISCWGRDRVLSVRTRLRAGQTEKFRFDSRQGQKFFFPPIFPVCFRPNSSSYSVGTGGLFLGQSGMGVKPTTQFHTVWNLGMGRAVPPLLHVTFTGIIPLLFTRYSVDFPCK